MRQSQAPVQLEVGQVTDEVTVAGEIAPNWGVINSTVTTSRQIQLGVKYLF